MRDKVRPTEVFTSVALSYRVESRHESARIHSWLPCVMQKDGKEVPAVFSARELMKADDFMNAMRSEHPRTSYRMVEIMTTERVMYA